MAADIYWIDGIAGGRLAIVGRPRAGDWLADEIADWKASGLTDIVSLLEAVEARETGLTQEAQWGSPRRSWLREFSDTGSRRSGIRPSGACAVGRLG